MQKLIALLILLSACSDSYDSRNNENIAGKWTNWSQSSDTISTSLRGQGYPQLTWTKYIVVKTDSGIFEYGYTNDTLSSIVASNNIDITEFEFLTDSSGYINTYEINFLSGEKSEMESNEIRHQSTFEITRYVDVEITEMIITPGHLLKPYKCQAISAMDKLLLQSSLDTTTLYRWSE